MSSDETKPLPRLPHERKWWTNLCKRSEDSSNLLSNELYDTEKGRFDIRGLIRSFWTANDVFTRRGRQQLKRTFLSSGPAASKYARLISAGKPNDTSGWRMGSLVSCYITGLCLALNTAFSIFAAVVDPTSEGIGTIYIGDCSKVKSLDRWLHLVINILGTALLSASNFNMQCLSSPTRKEVDAVHIKGKWLDIGVPSLNNLRHISWKRIILWWLFAVSTIPLHLLWNSVLFSTLQSNDYTTTVVNWDFLQHNGPNCSHAFDPDLKSDYLDVVCDMLNAAKAENLTKLEPKDCIEAYGAKQQTHWSNVFVVLNNATPPLLTNLTDLPSTFLASNWSSIYWTVTILSGKGNGWMCYEPEAVDCNQAGLLANSSHWTLKGVASYASDTSTDPPTLLVDHCLAKSSTETCKLQYSSTILFIVIASNTVKLVSIMMTLKVIKGQQFVTLGDAIASFLTDPDLNTNGACLATKRNILQNLASSKADHCSDDRTSVQTTSEVAAWSINKAFSNRWRHAPSRRRWIVCMILCLAVLVTAGALLGIGIRGLSGEGISDIWSVGFGSVDPKSLVVINHVQDYSGSFAVIGMALMANSPQLVFSVLYFMYNGLYTCMLASHEWSRLAQHKKALRVTSPTHVQRSTYWLQLPYRYGLPLSAACSLMHWLISQSIFLARIDVYDPRGQIKEGALDDPGSGSVSTCGYSVPAIILAMILGILMLLALVMTGHRKLDNGIPLVGSCSLAISAACHRPPGDQDAAFKPVKWGAVRHGTNQGPGHCCITTCNVEPPIPGQYYAGYKDD